MIVACRCQFVLLVLAAVHAALIVAAAAEQRNQTAIVDANDGLFDAASLEFFESKIRPLLAARCHKCHGPEKQEGSLRLDSRAAILRGGDSGPAIVPKLPDESLLIDAVRYGETVQMPPKQQLPPQEVKLLEEWVRRGAPWTTGDTPPSTATLGSFDLQQRKREHWAWRPIVAPAVPTVARQHGDVSAIDAFLFTKLDSANVETSEPADRRTLLRRATFDLIGLPPTPEEIAAFEADMAPDAFARVVDRLLASPHFGERWARHWLDLVRYAETLGHEYDYPLTEPWRYRDYVIRALNTDVPYDQFVREHIAGDLLNPPRLHPTEQFDESIIATAFWYFGEALHAPVDVRADQAVRVENQIDVFSKAFLALTLACARCHDHKFDAISTKDYYALAGYLTSSHQQKALLDPGDRIEKCAAELRELSRQGSSAVTSFAAQDEGETADRFARCLLASRSAHAHGATDSAALDAIAKKHGVDRSLVERFVAVCGEAAAQEPGHPLYVWNRLAAEDLAEDSFLSRRSGLETSVVQRREQAAAAAQGEQVFEDFSNGFAAWFPSGWAFGDSPTHSGDWWTTPEGPRLLPAGVAHSGRFALKLPGVLRSTTFTIEHPYILYRLCGREAQVRLIVDGYVMDNFTELLFEGLSFKVNTGESRQWHSQSVARYLGHRAHIELIDAGDGFLAVDEIRFANAAAADAPDDSISTLVLGKPAVNSTESLAKAYGEICAQGCQDWHIGKPSASAEFVRWVIAERLLPGEDAVRSELEELAKQANKINSVAPSPAEVVAISDGGPDDQPVLIRGNPKNAGELAPRRFLEAIAGNDQPAPPHGSGRLELAERMLSVDNPFPARVMVNRIWQHLFGRGIVATVDNFGVLGTPPTHPELLDYLANRFREEGWSIKKLIREVMLTRAYQRSSVGSESAEQRDPENLLLHRANVRRLEGEAIRDALLAVTGSLDRKQFGPSIPIHLSPFMEGRGRPKESGPLDGAGRRSIYVEVRRNFLSPFMLAFDTPQPASAVGRRNTSNVPAQALSMMNDPFVVEQCRLWATHILAAKGETPQQRATRLYWAAFSRPPSPQEVNESTSFLEEQARSYGVGADDERPWADLCHVLVNVKEFVFIR